MKTIVLAEKPSVAREIARVLGCTKKTKCFIEGKDYIVTWAMGHLVELADPGEYEARWKSWDLEYLPMLPERMRHKVIRRTSHQFRTIKSLFARNDTGALIVATDAGREGELVARWIMRLAGWKGKHQRLWISSQTDKAIRDGFKNLKPGASYDNLLRAAECRAEADWIIGLNVTRALSCKYDARLSAGRVQTPTLAMIIARENEIKSFVPQPFWTVIADLGTFKAAWQSKNGITRFKEQDKAKAVAAKVEGKEGSISGVESKEKSEMPPLAYDLTALQRDANKILNFSAKKTLSTLQSLYERHKIVTYPRTDSRYITDDIVPTLKERLKAIENTSYQNHVKKLLDRPLNPGKRLVDNKKVTDHHAIIPTEEKVDLSRLSNEEKALWNLIAKRFLAVLMPAYKYSSLKVTVLVEGETFTARGTHTISQGWRSVSGAENDETADDDIPFQNLSSCKKGDPVQVKKVTVPQGFTKPPARYTEGTLLGAMESPGKFVEGKELKSSIEKGGLGTPATRADIIEKLFAHHYIERSGKELKPTSQGFELISLVPETLRSPELTARWELRLTGISEGKEKSSLFSRDIRENAKELVAQVKGSSLEFNPTGKNDTPCPMCGRKMMATTDKKGRKLLVCAARSCGYEQSEHSLREGSGGMSRKEKAMGKRLISKYTDKQAKETFTLGDLLKASMEKNNNKKKK